MKASAQRYYQKNKEKHSEVQRAWKLKNSEYLKAWRGRYQRKERWPKDLQKKYGITVEEFSLRLAQQDNVCAICKEVNKSSKQFAVDHCHLTGKVRGLLCNRCNLMLGLIQDSTDLLSSAKKYLIEGGHPIV